MKPAPIGGLRPPSSPKLADVAAEQARREHDTKIRELQLLPASALRILSGLELADGVVTPVAHGLGRPPAWIAPSVVRGPAATGRIEEIRDNQHDRASVVLLKASGWGATITLDLAVM